MEVARITKGGVVYRIIANHPIYGMYEIEKLRTYQHHDGTMCDVWSTAIMPIRIFGTIDEARNYIYYNI